MRHTPLWKPELILVAFQPSSQLTACLPAVCLKPYVLHAWHMGQGGAGDGGIQSILRAPLGPGGRHKTQQRSRPVDGWGLVLGVWSPGY